MFTKKLFFVLLCCSASTQSIYCNQKADKDLKDEIAKLSGAESKKHLFDVIKQRDEQDTKIKNIIIKEERRQAKINGYTGVCLLVGGIVSFSKMLENTSMYAGIISALTLLGGIMMVNEALFKESILEKIKDEITPNEFEESEHSN